jgi:hypothetical protein
MGEGLLLLGMVLVLVISLIAQKRGWIRDVGEVNREMRFDRWVRSQGKIILSENYQDAQRSLETLARAITEFEQECNKGKRLDYIRNGYKVIKMQRQLLDLKNNKEKNYE